MKYIKKFEEIFEVAKVQPERWWKKYTQYKLSAYPPPAVKEEDVEVDLSGDINTHPVLTWNSPTTGKKVYSYTKERVDAQKEEKYARVEQLSQGQIEKMTVICHDVITSDSSSDLDKQAATVVSIIAQTGLRPGSKKGFEATHNRGVTTLSAQNIKISGSKIKFNFTGKSYADNVAEFEDGAIAHYLTERMKKLKKSDFVFDISKDKIDSFMKGLPKMSNFKVKDLRTHIANRIAEDFLENDPLLPPPVPNDPKEIKRVVTAKLKKAFEFVSRKLNNTPAMAKHSYVNPVVIIEWLKHLGIKQTESTVTESKEIGSNQLIGNAPVYKLPEWWDSDEVELIKDLDKST